MGLLLLGRKGAHFVVSGSRGGLTRSSEIVLVRTAREGGLVHCGPSIFIPPGGEMARVRGGTWPGAILHHGGSPMEHLADGNVRPIVHHPPFGHLLSLNVMRQDGLIL